MRNAALTILALAALLLAGCGNRESGLIGSWSGQVEIPESVAKNPQAAPFMKNLDMGASLDLRSDHTFELSALGATSNGTWSTEKDAVLLTIKTAGGKTVEELKSDATKMPGMSQAVAEEAFKPLRFQIGAGNSELTGEAGPGAKSGKIVLKKQAK